MNSLQLTLKYAARRAVHFNPFSVAWARGAPKRERLSDAEREVLTDRALLETLSIAARNIPAYQHLRGRIPSSGLAQFLVDHVPVITKIDLQRGRQQYYPNGGQSKPWWGIGKTSGTTGSPLEVFRSVQSMAMEQAVLLQHWQWAGFGIHDRQVVLRGDLVVPPEQDRPPYWFHDRAGHSLIVSTRHLNRANIGLIADAISNFGGKWLRCYPSAGYELARLLSGWGDAPRFSGIITGSEPVYPVQRERMEATFQCRLYAGYGMAERVVYAAECEYGHMHVNLDYSHAEIVDERGQPTTGSGYLVGTSFHNKVMPLVRYRLDDTARWAASACPCGRRYPVVTQLEGRVEDQLFDLNGNIVNSAVVTFVFKEARPVQRAQVAQVARDRWEVRVVPEHDYSEEVGRSIEADFRRLVSPHLNVQVRCVDHIDSLPSGKFKWVAQEWQAGVAGG
jgi:phenylacetate-CoA ligase